jgi:hypothetical protein
MTHLPTWTEGVGTEILASPKSYAGGCSFFILRMLTDGPLYSTFVE